MYNWTCGNVVEVYINTSFTGAHPIFEISLVLFSFVLTGILALVQMAADSITLIGIGCENNTVLYE